MSLKKTTRRKAERAGRFLWRRVTSEDDHRPTVSASLISSALNRLDVIALDVGNLIALFSDWTDTQIDKQISEPTDQEHKMDLL